MAYTSGHKSPLGAQYLLASLLKANYLFNISYFLDVKLPKPQLIMGAVINVSGGGAWKNMIFEWRENDKEHISR